MFTEGHTSERTSVNSRCKALAYLGYPVPLSELHLSLRHLARCIQSVFKDVCYAYLPKPMVKVAKAKGYLYREINRSIILYRKDVSGAVKELMVNAIPSLMACSAFPIQTLVEFKSEAKSYRYAIIYLGRGVFAVITPSSVVRGLSGLNPVVETVVKDLGSSTNFESLKRIKALFQLDGDRVGVTYRCSFDDLTLEISAMNILYLLLYIGAVYWT